MSYYTSISQKRSFTAAGLTEQTHSDDDSELKQGSEDDEEEKMPKA